MIQVLVADDHAVVREGIKRIIDETPEMQVAAEASNGDEVLDLLNDHAFDVVVLDISMPGKTGLEVIKELRSRPGRTPILVLSMHAEDQYAVRMLRAGADGYLTKESAPQLLVKAIVKVYSGGKYISEAVAEQLATDVSSASERPLHSSLSDREFQVACLIASGMTVSEIGVKLGLSVKTISTYRARILEKMHLENNAQLTHYAVQHRLVDLSADHR